MPAPAPPPDLSPNLGRTGIPTVERFWTSGYTLNLRFRPSDCRMRIEGAWDPDAGQPPTVTPDKFTSRWGDAFESSSFFRNVTLIANHAADNPSASASCLRLVEGMLAGMLAACTLADGARFIRFDFPYQREGYRLSAGWVCALANGFCLRALARIEEAWPGALGARAAAEELALAYRVVNTGGRPRPWFTFVDPDGFLWLDEYPGDDGRPTLVLNGHIHALLGLFDYVRMTGCPVSAAIVDGAITTVRHNALRFRREGRVNRYSLRETREDYLPSRTARQQRELAQISGDPWFIAMQETFEADFAAAARRASSYPARAAASLRKAARRVRGRPD
jgi:hypothetical protein